MGRISASKVITMLYGSSRVLNYMFYWDHKQGHPLNSFSMIIVEKS